MTGNLFPARLRASHQGRRQNTNFRRNGKLQACEPCRKGKLRCDHMMPSCGRCSRRKLSDKCVYHPAPLKKAASVAASRQSNRDSSTESYNSNDIFADYSGHGAQAATTSGVAGAFPRHVTLQQPLASISHLVEHESTIALETFYQQVYPEFVAADDSPPLTGEQPHRANSEQQRSISTQFSREDVHQIDDRAAFTNESAVLAENELSIGIQPPTLHTPLKSNITQSHIERGATVLTLLRDFQSIQKYIDKWYSFASGFIILGPMVQIYIDGLWSVWHKTLEAQKPADLTRMSQKIWENTLTPVSKLLNRHTAPRNFCASVMGEALRWEVIGLIVTLVSLLAQSLKDGDPIFCTPDDQPIDRAELALKMLNASEMCVSFCDDFEVLNDLYLWLLYENSIAYCATRTRVSLESSKKAAAMSAAAICCNLHRDIKVDDQTPFFITELRKRLFICVYANDKRFAISSGRPPSLTRQYCQLQVPLDLTDAQIMSEGLELESAIRGLDEGGWNRRDTIQWCTYARLNATNALIAEEILEISLGHLDPDKVTQRATDIETKTNKCWADLPDFLKINIESPWDSKRAPLELLHLMCIRLGHLEHHFLLQRTISKISSFGSENPNTNLLSVCDKIFRLVLLIVENKDYFRDFQMDYISILAVHGVPTAAVLAVELLNQERKSSAAFTNPYPLHRSETIQRLSVFVSCLGSLRAEAHDSQSFGRGHNFLKKVLDMILGPGPAAALTGIIPPRIDDLRDPIFGNASLQAGSDGDFVKWTDNMDWDQDIWVNFD